MKRYLNLLGLVIAWLAIFGVFSYLAPKTFPTLANVETLARQVVIVGFGSIGMTYIIIAAGIDLSAGSVVALVSVVIATMIQRGVSPGASALIGIGCGGVCGLIMGLLISKLNVGPFIVTLAGLTGFRGIAKGLAHEQTVDAPQTWLTNFTAALGPHEKWKLISSGAWLMLACAAFFSWALRYTVFGRHVVALGSNEQAARLSGIRVNRVKASVYVLGGIFFGIAGLMQFSSLTVGDPTAAVGLELDIIAAVVIGGASLSGGEGSIFGSLIGAMIMRTIRTGGNHLGLENWIMEIITGVIILLAVTFDRWRTARAAAAAA